MKLQTILSRFLRIGATGFGGPMALIGLIHTHMVEQRKEITQDEFAEGVALGQLLPGPVAVDCATYVGYRLRGFAGAVAGTAGIVMPAFFLMLVLTPLYFHYGEVPQVSGFFKGVGPAVVAVILAAAWRMGKRFLTDTGAVVIGVVALAAGLLRASPVLVILLGGCLGMLVRLRQNKEEKA